MVGWYPARVRLPSNSGRAASPPSGQAAPTPRCGLRATARRAHRRCRPNESGANRQWPYKIRLLRMGKIRNPQYRIVVADSRTKRDGRAIEYVGHLPPEGGPLAASRSSPSGCSTGSPSAPSPARPVQRDPREDRRLAEVQGPAGPAEPLQGRRRASRPQGGLRGRGQGRRRRRRDRPTKPAKKEPAKKAAKAAAEPTAEAAPAEAAGRPRPPRPSPSRRPPPRPRSPAGAGADDAQG